MKRALRVILMFCLALGFTAGSYQTVKVAGEAVKGMEDGVQDTKKGYEHGKSDKDK